MKGENMHSPLKLPCQLLGVIAIILGIAGTFMIVQQNPNNMMLAVPMLIGSIMLGFILLGIAEILRILEAQNKKGDKEK